MAKKTNKEDDKPSKGSGQGKEEGKDKPHMNPELEGFEISINEFGQISSTYDLDKVYEFLNKNVDDKKLRGRDLDEEDKEEDDEEEEPEK